jgi:hypothetical protein
VWERIGEGRGEVCGVPGVVGVAFIGQGVREAVGLVVGGGTVR